MFKVLGNLNFTDEEYAHFERSLSQFSANPQPSPFPIYTSTSVSSFKPTVTHRKVAPGKMKFIGSRQKFPLFTNRGEVISLIKERKVVGVVCSPSTYAAGCATQLPQILIEHESFARRRLYVVRPNDSLCRVAAARVSQEMCCEHDEVMWYNPLLASSRFSATPSSNTQIVFVTPAVMLHILLCRDSTETDFALLIEDMTSVLDHIRDPHDPFHIRNNQQLSDYYTLLSVARHYLRMGSLIFKFIVCSASVEADSDKELEKWLTCYTQDLTGFPTPGLMRVPDKSKSLSPSNVPLLPAKSLPYSSLQGYLSTSSQPTSSVSVYLCSDMDTLEKVTNDIRKGTNNAVFRFTHFDLLPQDIAWTDQWMSVFYNSPSQAPASFSIVSLFPLDSTLARTIQDTLRASQAVVSNIIMVEGERPLESTMYNVTKNTNQIVQLSPDAISRYQDKALSYFHGLLHQTCSVVILRQSTYSNTATSNFILPPESGTFVSDDVDMNLVRHTLICKALGVDPIAHVVVFNNVVAAHACLASAVRQLCLQYLIDRSDVTTVFGNLVAFLSVFSSANLYVAKLLLLGNAFACLDFAVTKAAALALRSRGVSSQCIQSNPNELETVSKMIQEWLRVTCIVADDKDSNWCGAQTVIKDAVVLGALYPNIAFIGDDGKITLPWHEEGLTIVRNDEQDGSLTSDLLLYTTAVEDPKTQAIILRDETDGLLLSPSFTPLSLVLFCGRGAVEGEYPAQLNNGGRAASGTFSRGWYHSISRAWAVGNFVDSDEGQELRPPIDDVEYPEKVAAAKCLSAIILDDKVTVVLDSETELPHMITLRKAVRAFFYMLGTVTTQLPAEVLQAISWTLQRNLDAASVFQVFQPDVSGRRITWLPVMESLKAEYSVGGAGGGLSEITKLPATQLERRIMTEVANLVATTMDRQIEYKLQTYNSPLLRFLEPSNPYFLEYQNYLLEICPSIQVRGQTDEVAAVADELAELETHDTAQRDLKKKEYMARVTFIRNENYNPNAAAGGNRTGMGIDAMFHDAPPPPMGGPAEPHMAMPPYAPGGPRRAMLRVPNMPSMMPPGAGLNSLSHTVGTTVMEASEEELEKNPAVIVEPVPPKKDGATNIPLILAKALGEAIGTKVGPTMLLNNCAQIKVPTKSIQEKAIELGCFMCLGERLNIRRNNLVIQHKNHHVTKKLQDIESKNLGRSGGGGGNRRAPSVSSDTSDPKRRKKR